MASGLPSFQAPLAWPHHGEFCQAVKVTGGGCAAQSPHSTSLSVDWLLTAVGSRAVMKAHLHVSLSSRGEDLPEAHIQKWGCFPWCLRLMLSFPALVSG